MIDEKTDWIVFKMTRKGDSLVFVAKDFESRTGKRPRAMHVREMPDPMPDGLPLVLDARVFKDEIWVV